MIWVFIFIQYSWCQGPWLLLVFFKSEPSMALIHRNLTQSPDVLRTPPLINYVPIYLLIMSLIGECMKTIEILRLLVTVKSIGN